MRRTAIAVSGLRKAYGDKTVLDGIDFDVAAGSVYSLLGPNGAGKTTTVNVLATLLTADAGSVQVAGHDVATATKQVRAAIGVTGQFAAVDDLLSGRENLQMMVALKRVRSGGQLVTRLLEQFDLVESADKMARTYSGGMRRKLDLAMTLVGSPEIIFLDEPTTGLDPRSRRTMWGIVRELVADGTTIFLTTQYLEEADELADRIAVLSEGKFVAEGTSEELKRLIPGGYVRLRFNDAANYHSAATALRDATADEETRSVQIPSDGTQRELRSILDWLDSSGIEADELTVHTPDLDDVFLALTERTSKEAISK
ncbi:ATP-binding cassette domain-containing protein [Streptomyces sp. NPDC050529]|uniref:ATP-binding cassette domain-containing protein n=1 Tax=unclassified Streptomyces TaxID=2593676 RepID=UPI002DD815C1|nr:MULTISPECIES: ATP-binding cassette domain-containing protein [unclassified Streptomyces]MEE4494135.1 ATP-binding cassette domain-containing protein [Streptomyces sp. BE230]WRZ87466.1 ATP-binding cassette domain-containing protein [Streptomyces sp. NBC_01022]